MPNGLPRGLEQVLLKCLQKERRLRYANAADLAAALAPFGSADARVSLSRVTGMWSSSHSSPSSQHLLHDSGSVATTLTLAAESQASRGSDKQQTSNIGPAPAPKRGRSWIILASAAALVAAVIALSKRAPEAGGAASRPLVEEPAQTAAVIAPTPAQTPPVVPAAPASAQAPAERSAAPAAKVAARSAREPERLANKAPPAPVASVSVPEPQAPLVEPVAVPDAPPASGLGRSPEIERLIEQRR
jgi:serine/threonine-protein kinase